MLLFLVVRTTAEISPCFVVRSFQCFFLCRQLLAQWGDGGRGRLSTLRMPSGVVCAFCSSNFYTCFQFAKLSEVVCFALRFWMMLLCSVQLPIIKSYTPEQFLVFRVITNFECMDKIYMHFCSCSQSSLHNSYVWYSKKNGQNVLLSDLDSWTAKLNGKPKFWNLATKNTKDPPCIHPQTAEKTPI